MTRPANFLMGIVIKKIVPTQGKMVVKQEDFSQNFIRPF